MNRESADNAMTIVDNSFSVSSSVPEPNTAQDGLNDPNDTIDVLSGTFQMPRSSMINDRPDILANGFQSGNAEVHPEMALNQHQNESNENEATLSDINEILDNLRVFNINVTHTSTVSRLPRIVPRVVPLIQPRRSLNAEPPEWAQARRILVNIRQRYRYIRQINRLIEPHSLVNLNRKKSKYMKKGSQKTSFHKYMLHYMNLCTTNTFKNKNKAHHRRNQL